MTTNGRPARCHPEQPGEAMHPLVKMNARLLAIPEFECATQSCFGDLPNLKAQGVSNTSYFLFERLLSFGIVE